MLNVFLLKGYSIFSHTQRAIWRFLEQCSGCLDERSCYLSWRISSDTLGQLSWWNLLWTTSRWKPGWWFGTFFIFPYIGNNHPNWLIFFRGVQTTNQPESQVCNIRMRFWRGRTMRVEDTPSLSRKVVPPRFKLAYKLTQAMRYIVTYPSSYLAHVECNRYS